MSTIITDYVEIPNGEVTSASDYIVDGGEVDIAEGGAVSDSVAMNAGFFWILSGGTARNISATMTGEAWVDNGGTAEIVTAESGGYLNAFGGGLVNSALILNSGYGVIYDGATATNATVSSGGAMLLNGGAADKTAVSSGGSFVVQSSNVTGVANSTTVLDGGTMRVVSSGLAQDTTMSGGFLEVLLGSATGTVVSGGSMRVAETNTIYNTTLNGGTLEINGATAISTTVTGGNLKTSSATITDVTLNGGSASFFGTTVSGMTLGSGVDAAMDSASTLSGKSVFMDGAVFTVNGGSVLFDTGISTAAEAQLQGFSSLTGLALYSLTADGATPGIYLLASDAASFNSEITFGDVTLSLGAEEPVMIGDYLYSLSLTTGNDLALSIQALDISFFTGRFDGGEKAMLARSVNNSLKIYDSNGNVWGTLVPGGDWEIVESGDFTGDKKDDFLRINEEGYVVGEMSNGDGTFTPQVLNLKSAGWDILGIGDFNGNGTDDVLIANPTGASETVGLLGYWESGVTWTLINGYSAEWEMVGTGDFNADGKCDMLWRNSFEGDGGLTYNAYCTWIVDPPAGQSDWRMVSVANPDDWNFLCTGDFNGDKMNDIAMINGEGVVGIWGVEDGWLSSWSILSAVTSEWKLAGVDDFNGDGTDDIAWCNSTNGQAGYWQINDKVLTSWQSLGTLA